MAEDPDPDYELLSYRHAPYGVVVVPLPSGDFGLYTHAEPGIPIIDVRAPKDGLTEALLTLSAFRRAMRPTTPPQPARAVIPEDITFD